MPCPSPEALAAAVPTPPPPLAAHLAECEACRAAHQRLTRAGAALTDLGHALPAPGLTSAVMARLDARPASARSPFLWPMVVATASLVAVVVLRAAPADVFTARGQARVLPVETFVTQGTQPRHPVREGQVLDDASRLTFVVHPPPGAPRFLMLLAVDGLGEVHWFYPAYRSAAEDPTSVQLPPGPAPYALPEAVAPSDVPAGPLTLAWLLTTEPLHVREVEAWVAAKGLDGLRGEGRTLGLHTVAWGAVQHP